MRQYDADRIKEVSLLTVAPFIGAETNTCGTTTFIRCPNGHKETRINHCSVSGDGKVCHCFSCGGGFNTISYVQTYYENVLGRTLAFPEICEIIGDAAGGHEYFLVSADDSAYKKKAEFPFTKDEVEAVGLSYFGITTLYLKDREIALRILSENAAICSMKYRRIARTYTDTEPELENEIRKKAESLYLMTKSLIKKTTTGGTAKLFR